jgi:hypothetical protein
MDAITETRDLPGVATNYGIELYDMDLDGVPELQECVTAHGNDYGMWFFEYGKATQITGRIPFEPEWDNVVVFANLFRHNKTGEIVAVHLAGSAFFSDEYCFKATGQKGIWELDTIWGSSSPSLEKPQKEYKRTDANGVEHIINEQEYNTGRVLLSKDYIILSGVFLSLDEYFRDYGETAEAFSAKLEKAPKIISDYFDEFDGIPSKVYKNYIILEATL